MVVRLRRLVVWLRLVLCVIQAFARFICGENAVRKRRNCGAEMVKMWCICGVYMLDFLHFCCQGGEMVVRLLRFLCVIQAFARLICCENAVRKWRNCGVFSACTCLISCIFVAKVAKWWCVAAVS